MHWTQKANARQPDLQLPEEATFYKTQERLFVLETGFMPPEHIGLNANTIVKIEADGTLSAYTEDIEWGENDEVFDNDLWDVYNNLEKVQDELEEELKVGAATVQWLRVRKVWLRAISTATNKLVRLGQRSFGTYILCMTTMRFKAYLETISKGSSSRIAEPPKSKRRYDYRWMAARALRTSHIEDVLKNMPHKSHLKWNDASNIPIPPLGVVFTPAERKVMGLIYMCQLAGKLDDCELVLANSEGALGLPAPFCDTSIEEHQEKFPIPNVSVEDAVYMVEQLTLDNIPADITPWIEVIQGYSYGDLVTEENGGMDVVMG